MCWEVIVGDHRGWPRGPRSSEASSGGYSRRRWGSAGELGVTCDPLSKTQRNRKLCWPVARIGGGKCLGRVNAREAGVGWRREVKGKERKSSIPRLIKNSYIPSGFILTHDLIPKTTKYTILIDWIHLTTQTQFDLLGCVLFHMVFIDLEKSYDKIPRNIMWWALDKHKVPTKYVTLIKDIRD